MNHIDLTQTNTNHQNNPLLSPFNTPFGVPPFHLIKDEHYENAFTVAMEQHAQEIEQLINNKQAPSFENTIEALEYSGHLLNRVAMVFFPKHSADTNDDLQKIATTVAPKLSAHNDSILMNAKLFKRVKAVFDQMAKLKLTTEQQRLVTETYKNFTRGGALLTKESKQRLTEINQRLAVLGLKFGENLLAENNKFKLVISDKRELAGLPKNVIERAFEVAKQNKLDGKWVFTLHQPSFTPFMQFCDNRQHRKTIFEAYIERGNHEDELDNKAIVIEMTGLRVEKAQLLGCDTHADFVLQDNMAKSHKNVQELLEKLWAAANPIAQKEASALTELMHKSGVTGELQPYDWAYFTEKLRKAKYNISDAEIRPFFELKKVQQGAFDVAHKLYGLQFDWRKDLPVYHPDVQTVEVKEATGKHIGILYLDYFPRSGKHQGAWMTEYRGQEIKNQTFITPIVANVFNFSRGTGNEPDLLNFEEVETLFHEFGHALHGLLSAVHYPGLAGTNVVRDFVELPSQFMENWALESQVMKAYARHFETDASIPDTLIQKMKQASRFNQGFQTTEYLAAAFLDLYWHSLTEKPTNEDVVTVEKTVLDQLGLIPQIVSRYRSTYFAHIFDGGYSAGYYSYIWSAVLDCDAFEAFKSKENLFDKETADAFRTKILAKGNAADPMAMYVDFKKAEPSIEPLLKKRGLIS